MHYRKHLIFAVRVLATVVALVLAVSVLPERSSAHSTSGPVMLILRGIANAQHPRGQLDDRSALEYARRLGYQGEVLNVAGNTSAQINMAIARIRHDEDVTAIYGFSGGGYAARTIWHQLKAEERERIDTIVVVGSPGVRVRDFPGGSADVFIQRDPPAGHMAGPKALLQSLN